MSLRTYLEDRRTRKQNARQILTQLESMELEMDDYLETRFGSIDDKLRDDDLRDVLAPHIMSAGVEASVPTIERVYSSTLRTQLRSSLKPPTVSTPKQLFGASEIAIDASAIVIYSLLSERFDFESALERFRQLTGIPAASCSSELITLAPRARGSLESAFVDRVHDAVIAYCITTFVPGDSMTVTDSDKALFDTEFRAALSKGMEDAGDDMDNYEARMRDRRIRAADTALSESE